MKFRGDFTPTSSKGLALVVQTDFCVYSTPDSVHTGVNYLKLCLGTMWTILGYLCMDYSKIPVHGLFQDICAWTILRYLCMDYSKIPVHGLF